MSETEFARAERYLREIYTLTKELANLRIELDHYKSVLEFYSHEDTWRNKECDDEKEAMNYALDGSMNEDGTKHRSAEKYLSFKVGCSYGRVQEREMIIKSLKDSFPKNSDGPYRCGEWFADWLEEELTENI